MLPQRIALLSATGNLSMAELAQVAAAIQVQVARDVSPIWQVAGNVAAFQSSQDVPLGYWPVTITNDDLGDGFVGYHEGPNGQPFARVHYDADWTVGASHEIIEMLVDPFGRYLHPGSSPKPDQGHVSFVVEICDPPQVHSYPINGIQVSDFVLPIFYREDITGAGRYSFTGAITIPLQVLPGGYISWYEPISRIWWQMFVDDAGQVEFDQLTQPAAGMAIRSFIDKNSRAHLKAKMEKAGKVRLAPVVNDAKTKRRDEARAASLAQAETFEAFIKEYGKNQ